MRQDFIFDGRYLGSMPRKPLLIDRDFAGLPLSTGFFCRVCGNPYAHCPVHLPDGTMTSWRMISGICPRCPADGVNPPGSIWHYPEVDFFTDLPEPVLLREVDLHLKALQQEIKP